MANTHCKNCMFSKEAKTTDPCDFGIIEIIKNSKELSIIDNYFYIKNYRCAYGLSENIYNQYPELQKTDNIQNFVADRAKLKYYLLLDLRNLSNVDIISKIDEIKTFNIKPKFISLICNQDSHDQNLISQIHKSFKGSSISWKIHLFLHSIPLNDCINIAAETTIPNFDEKITALIINDYTNKEVNNLFNDHINYVHYVFKVLQNDTYCIANETNSLNMMAMFTSLYKSIISTISKDILYGINNIKELKIGHYDLEASK